MEEKVVCHAHKIAEGKHSPLARSAAFFMKTSAQYAILEWGVTTRISSCPHLISHLPSMWARGPGAFMKGGVNIGEILRTNLKIHTY